MCALANVAWLLVDAAEAALKSVCACRRSGAGHQRKWTETPALVRLSQKQGEESGVLAHADAARSAQQRKDGLACSTHKHTNTHTNPHTTNPNPNPNTHKITQNN